MLKMFDPRFVSKPQRGMPQARGSGQGHLPGQKCVKKKDSKHTAYVLYIYQHVMFTMQCMQMFNLVYISSGI